MSLLDHLQRKWPWIILLFSGIFLLLHHLLGLFQHPLAQNVLAGAIGAMITVIVTKFLLGHQTEYEEAKEKSTELFSQKVERFDQLINQLASLADGDRVEDEELKVFEQEVRRAALVMDDDTLTVLLQFRQQLEVFRNADMDFEDLSELEQRVFLKYYSREDFVNLWDIVTWLRKDLGVYGEEAAEVSGRIAKERETYAALKSRLKDSKLYFQQQGVNDESPAPAAE